MTENLFALEQALKQDEAARVSAVQAIFRHLDERLDRLESKLDQLISGLVKHGSL